MSHTKHACFNLQDLRLLWDHPIPKLTSGHLTRAAGSTPYLENSHSNALFLLPLFICWRRRKACGPLPSQLRVFSSVRALQPIGSTWRPLEGGDMPMSASYSATAEMSNAYLLPLLLMMTFNWRVPAGPGLRYLSDFVRGPQQSSPWPLIGMSLIKGWTHQAVQHPQAVLFQ